MQEMLVLTALCCPEVEWDAGRALVLHVEGHDLGCDVGEGPEIVHVTRAHLPFVAFPSPAGFRLAVNNTVLPNGFSLVRSPELNLK